VDGLEEEDGVDEFSKRHELVTSQRLRWGSGPSPSSSPTPTTAFSGLFRTKAVAWSANVPLDELDEAIANDGKKGFVLLRASTEKYAEASSSRRSQEFDVDPYDYDAGRGVSTCGGGRESGGEWRGGASSSAKLSRPNQAVRESRGERPKRRQPCRQEHCWRHPFSFEGR